MPSKSSQWQAHKVLRLNADAAPKELPAQGQIMTESWNRVVAVPHVVYMPEKKRVLMLLSCDYAGNPYLHYAMVLYSDDLGASWSDPEYVHTDAKGNPDAGLGHALTYLGQGKLLLYTHHPRMRWFSSDYGRTWPDTVPIQPTPSGKKWMAWDPVLVDRDPQTGKVLRLMETGYAGDSQTMSSQAYIRFSTDEGETWSDALRIPEFAGINEVCPVRAQNGDIVATCRTDPPPEYKQIRFDHYEGFGVSISKDNGYTWSKVRQLYDWGRHHASTVLLPDGGIVVSYVVRLGYPDTDDSFPQFGIEAVTSHDNGVSWNLERRYVLASWAGNKKGTSVPADKASCGAWQASSHTTSSILLPDGSILTAYGTGYRQQEQGYGPGLYGPRDVGLVKWNVDSD